MAGYLGSVPVPQATQHRESFTATEGQTSFATAGYTPQFVDVYLNGSHLSPADFTASNGSDVVLGVSASADDVCDIISYTPFEIADQTFTGTIDITGELKTTTLGTSNFRAGVNAGDAIASGGNFNTVVGDEAGTAITTGDHNTFVGAFSGIATATTADNTALGLSTLRNNVGSYNTALGSQALRHSVDTNYNTAVGYKAGYLVTVGIRNTLIGGIAGDALTDADYNVAMGYQALTTDTLGSRSVAIGYSALRDQAFTTATNTYNTAVGYQAGTAVTTGISNTIIGGLAGDALTGSGFDGNGARVAGADNNVAIGIGALGADTKGSRSIAIGEGALSVQNFTSATLTNNTVVGSAAGFAVSTGVNNTLVGGEAGANATTADSSVFVGYAAGKGISGTKLTGDNNTAVGKHAGLLLQGTSNRNTILGSLAGDNLTTGDNNVLIGYASRMNSAADDNANGFGYNITAVSGFTTLGNANDDIRAAHGNTTWNTVSDQRYKKDIVNSTAGLSFINDLTPRTFKYKNLGELPETFNAYKADSTTVFKNSNTNHGFIAQEVKAAIDAHSELKDGFAMWGERPDGGQEIGEAALIPILTKAVQELSTALDAALARITTLEG